MTKNVLGVADTCPPKPLDSSKVFFWINQHLPIHAVGFDIVELPNAFPEIFQIGHRPIPQVVVVSEIESFFDKQPILKLF